MQAILLIIGGIVLFYVFRFILDRTKGFGDPKTMTRHHLVSAIAGQADWIEKMRASPWETQQMPSILKLTLERKNYIVRLCVEVVSRDGEDGLVFYETAQYAKELELSGITKEKASVRAVKEKLFDKSGVFYPSSWEI